MFILMVLYSVAMAGLAMQTCLEVHRCDLHKGTRASEAHRLKARRLVGVIVVMLVLPVVYQIRIWTTG